MCDSHVASLFLQTNTRSDSYSIRSIFSFFMRNCQSLQPSLFSLAGMLIDDNLIDSSTSSTAHKLIKSRMNGSESSYQRIRYEDLHVDGSILNNDFRNIANIGFSNYNQTCSNSKQNAHIFFSANAFLHIVCTHICRHNFSSLNEIHWIGGNNIVCQGNCIKTTKMAYHVVYVVVDWKRANQIGAYWEKESTHIQKLTKNQKVEDWVNIWCRDVRISRRLTLVYCHWKLSVFSNIFDAHPLFLLKKCFGVCFVVLLLEPRYASGIPFVFFLPFSCICHALFPNWIEWYSRFLVLLLLFLFMIVSIAYVCTRKKVAVNLDNNRERKTKFPLK